MRRKKMSSEQINELATALAKAQSEIEAADKTGFNPHFASKFSTLTAIWDAIRAPLTKNGLSVTQLMESHEKELFVKTVMLHSSGQSISSMIPVLSKDRTPQSMGSAITYARRYSLAAICGVTQEDDDANAAQGIQSQSPAPGPIVAPPIQIKPVPHYGPSDSQLKRLHALKSKSGWTDEQVKKFMKNNCDVDSSKELNPKQYDFVCNTLIAVAKQESSFDIAIAGAGVFKEK
jgi:hypothetical protein